MRSVISPFILTTFLAAHVKCCHGLISRSDLHLPEVCFSMMASWTCCSSLGSELQGIRSTKDGLHFFLHQTRFLNNLVLDGADVRAGGAEEPQLPPTICGFDLQQHPARRTEFHRRRPPSQTPLSWKKTLWCSISGLCGRSEYQINGRKQ